MVDKRLFVVLSGVFTKKGERAAIAGLEDAGIDELGVDAMQTYSKRMGRWRRETLSTLDDPLFQPLVRIMRVPHQILHHVLCFLQHRFDDETIGKFGSHVPQIVIFKAAEFANEFSSKVEDCTWIQATIRDINEEHQRGFVRIALLMVLHHAAAYDRRIHKVYTRFV